MDREAVYNIIYLSHKKIDKKKWDACISNAGNGLIYGYAFYLDTMSRYWDALIMNDYEAVMPLTFNRKYGISYLYQPFFTASLGVFGNTLSAEIIKSFLENIPEKFKYWDIKLNHGNLFSIQDFNLHERSNYVLDLNKSYERISSSFSQNHTRNIKKANQSGCYIEKNIEVVKVIELAKQQSKNFSSASNSDYENFSKLYTHLHNTGKAITYGVFNSQQKLISCAVFFFSHNRAFYILAANHPDSKDSGGSHFLINEFIKDNAGKKLLLDFEGSMVKGVAEFYKKFGAAEEKYAALKLNRLPSLLRLFKK